MSIVSDAFAARRRCREEFELYLEAQHTLAHEECHGVMLNPLGKRLDIDTHSLFLGSADRAFLYASVELMRWWDDHRRVNYRQFEEAWVGNGGEYGLV